MRTRLFMTAIVLTLAGAGRAVPAVNLYVSPIGNDAWSGNLSARDKEGLAGPFASLTRARDELRRLKAAGKLGDGAIVNLRAGTYRLTTALALGPEDAGTPQAPIAWRAYGDEKVVLTGSLPVSGFKPWKGQIVVADLKGTPLEKVAFRQLFFRGERQVMARYPNVDPKDPHFGQWAYVLATDPAPATNRSVSDNIPQAKDHFTATRDVIKPTWEKITQAEIAIHPAYGWAWNIVPLKSVDKKTDTVWLGRPADYGLMIGDRYFVQNLLAELDAPGEWYLDRDEAKLYFWPPLDLKSGEVSVPVAESLVVAVGAGGVTVRGLTIESCRGDAVTLKNCEGSLVAGCTIRNTGLWGVSIVGGHNTGAAGNNIYATGAGGVSINSGDRKALTRGDCYAENNYIHHIAAFQRTYNTGVNLSGVGNRASHNLIHDCYHQAILIGGNDHVAEYNIIHHTNLGSEDTGGLYMSSRDFTQRGTVIRYNVFHHVGGFGKNNSWNPVRNGQVEFHYPGFTWGIYLDAPEVGCTILGNVLYSVPVCGLFNHEGRDNRWENNIIVDAPAFQASSGNYPDLDELSYSYIKALREKGGYDTYLRHYPELAAYTDDPATHHTCAPGKFARNIIYYTADGGKMMRERNQGSWAGGQLVWTFRGSKPAFTGFEFDYNCLYAPPELPLKFHLTLPPDSARLLNWDQWRQQGKDGHSLLADPKFVDPAKHDYRLRPDSPALKLGFQPIPFEKIGPYRDPLRASWPVVEAPGAAALGDFTTQRFFKLPGCEPVPAVGLQKEVTSGSVAAGGETGPAKQASLTLYVSPEGNDAWSGKLPAPNAERIDGPLATLQAARDRIRKAKTASTLAQGATVLVRGGFYFLKEPLSFGPEDSGTAAGPITYAAYPGEVPVVSGGVSLKGWQRREGGRWQIHLPEVQRGEWSFTQLFVNGERRYRPRLPRDGYYRIAKEGPSPGKDKAPDSFQFKPGQLDPAWPDLQDVEVLVFHSWTMDRLRIKAVDAGRRLVTFTAPTLGNVWFFDLRAGKRFLVENVAAALERPGQWHLDRKTGMLTYLPMPGEKPDTAEVIAPRIERLLILRGDAAAGRPVEHLVLRGLTLAHSNWTTPAEGWRCGQSESSLSGALSAVAARHCLFDACKIAHVGTYAMDLGEGCQHNRIENCEMTDMAAGGVKIGEMGIRDDEKRLTSHNVVRNNLIAHGGRMHAAGMGVWIGHSPLNLVEHNEICDFYQTGISAGWSWGYGRSQAHDNTIAYNRIHDIGQGVTDDMGGIYTLGVSTGTVLHHNLIHDVACDAYGGRGIYFDEGTSEILAENNIVYHTDAGAFMHHYGRDNRVLNNIFALARGGQLDRLREENHRSFTFKHNIVYYDDAGTLLWENWGNNQYVVDENLYWKAGGQPVLFGNLTLAEWQKKGHDRDSLIADPLFVDPAGGDFTLKPGSPASRIGFKPFDLKTAGRVPPPKQEEPLAPRAFPPKAQAEPISKDFESVPVGGRAPGTVTSEENDKATVRVTDETAAGGKHSIKFIDMPGQKQNFNPHFYYQTEFTSGVMEGHFDVRLQAGFQLCYEWRDTTVFYQCGPQLRLFPDGTLNASGKNLMKIPLGQWVGIDIVCGLGKQATKTYDLAVRLPGEAQPRRFTGLSCGPGFTRVHWLIFTAEGTEDGTCYVDNIRLAPRSEPR